MRTFKTMLITGMVILSLALNGCTLFPSNKTRPAPVRPRMTVKSPLKTPKPAKTMSKKVKKVIPKVKMKKSPTVKTTPVKSAVKTGTR